MKRRVLLSAAGAGVFFVLDSLHVRLGIWKAMPSTLVPWWYGFFYFLGILACAQILRRIEDRTRPAARPNLGLDLWVFVALLVAHALFFRPELVLTLFSVAVLGLRLLFFRRPGDLVVAPILALLEAGVECVLAKTGHFAYSYASLGPLPLWHLPFWAALALSVRGFFLAADPLPGRESPARRPETKAEAIR